MYVQNFNHHLIQQQQAVKYLPALQSNAPRYSHRSATATHTEQKIKALAQDIMHSSDAFLEQNQALLPVEQLGASMQLLKNVIHLNQALWLLSENEADHLSSTGKQSLKAAIDKLHAVKKHLFPQIRQLEKQLESSIDDRIRAVISTVQVRKKGILPAVYLTQQTHLLTLRTQLEALTQQNVTPAFAEPQLKKINALLAVVASQLETKAVVKPAAVSQIYKTASQLRRQLIDVRHIAAQSLSSVTMQAETIALETSQKLQTFIGALYQEGIAALRSRYGEPPCKFCLTFFGSLARQEAGPYPDIDHMLLVEKKTPATLKYFQRLNQYVADRIYRLGETPETGLVGLRFCSGDMNPPYQGYTSRYAAATEPQLRRGSELLLDEPQNFALWQSPHANAFKQANHDMAGKINSQTDVSAYQGIGDPSLLSRYQEEVECHLNNPSADGSTPYRTYTATERLEQITDWIQECSLVTKQHLSSIVNVKADLYRFPQIVVANLAVLHGIKEQNTFDRLRLLQAKGIFQAEFAERLLHTLDFIIYMRTKTQLLYGEDFEALSSHSYEQLVAEKEGFADVLVEMNHKRAALPEEINANTQALTLLRYDAQQGDLMAESKVAHLERENRLLAGQINDLDGKIAEVEKTLGIYTKMLGIPKDQHPLLKAAESDLLRSEVMPVLNHLYKMAARASRSGFNDKAFSRAMP